MRKSRLEAFSDGVIAIIITIMVLELKAPHGSSLDSLKPLVPIIISYILSFINIAIYWNNHHHMLHAAEKVNGSVLWANIHLLFWLSLVPFVTAWMGENNFTTIPLALYGFVLLMSGVAYFILGHQLISVNGKDSILAIAFGKNKKGIASIIIYAAGIGLSFLNSLLGLAAYALVTALWIIPDKRIEDKVFDP